MVKNRVATARPSLSATAIVLFCTLCVLNVQAADYRFGNPNRLYYPDGYYGPGSNFELRQDMKHLDDQMRRQQRQLQEQARQQQEQTQLLRQQQSAQQRLTAMQACYYRLNGGLDLCERLFDAASEENAACIETVNELNPGCATPSPLPRQPASEKSSGLVRPGP